MIETSIKSMETGKSVKISDAGELIIRSFDFSIPIFQNMNSADTAFNFFDSKAGFKFVINVGVNGAVVDIYEATADNTTTIDTQILKFEMQKSTSKVLTSLNFITTDEGKFINAKTDDTNVLLTISGFFIPT